MKRKGIPKKRIGPEAWSWERSIRMRQFKVSNKTLNAAERSAYGCMSVSLCGIMEKKKNKREKEVRKEWELLNVLLGGRSRGWLAPNLGSVGV